MSGERALLDGELLVTVIRSLGDGQAVVDFGHGTGIVKLERLQPLA